MTLAAALRDLRAQLEGAGIAAAALEARLLAAHAIGLTPDAVRTPSDRTMTEAEAALLAELSQRRLSGEPVARITGEWEFWGMAFALSPDTLIPRADTETLVEIALEELDARGMRHAKLRIADLGTGTGCLLAALLRELPRASGIGTDIAEGAVTTARANLARHGLDARSEIRLADWTEGLAERFDLVVSNPPYIAHNVLPSLDAEVRAHDPSRALDGGADGLDFYRRLVSDLPGLLASDGLAVLEIGYDQAQEATRLFRDGALIVGAVRTDLAGNPRALVVRKDQTAGVALA